MPAARARDDLQPFRVPWTAELALRAARVDSSLSREAQVAALRSAIDEKLPAAAVEALIAAGWTELEL